MAWQSRLIRSTYKSVGRCLPDFPSLVLAGELDSANLKEFKVHVKELVAEGFRKIIVDCHDLGVVTSTGLAALLWARSTIFKLGGSIYLTHVSGLVNDVLQLTKLSRLLKIEPTTRGLLEKLRGIRKSPTRVPRKRPTVSSADYR